ncbi:MmgE/PrpD family protein [Steroidobacter sp. S1-65]|uniref:MmgE/PrpD family protein n=1 Tax=Steroidobacter gossypii TaxID=2805490 RepID=A0ABS1WUI9_9GAMM|nr:MmgE/PrpD family protein [Steroidobacter gossypii]
MASFVVSTRYEDIPEHTREMAKRCLLDGLGVSLAATGLAPVCRPFVEHAMEQGGHTQSTVFASGVRLPAAMAAFANGALAHALDFEDAHDESLLHPNAPTIPAALAVCEAFGPIEGKELIAALVLGCDVACRLSLALRVPLDEYGWYPPPMIAAFGATAAVGRLLKLNEQQLIDAFSLTLGQATCSAELKFSPHSDIRAVRDAFPAQIAVTSVLLARKGVRGFDRPFEGRAGFFALYARGAYEPETVTHAFGESFAIDRISFKPYPSCRGTHVYIEAAAQLVREHRIDSSDIVSIKLVGSRLNLMLAEPVAQKRRPATAIDAKFSLPFTVATALRCGTVTLDDFTDRALQDAAVLDLAGRANFSADPARGTAGPDVLRGSVELELSGGRRVKLQIDQPSGSPSRPASEAALIEKFRDCCRRARSEPAPPLIDRWVEQILTLEKCADAGEIARLM